MSMSDEYQPLARYGPVGNLTGRETLFRPDLELDRLRSSPRSTVRLSRSWPGFQLVLLMHDGKQGRGLSLWKSPQTLDNYVTRHQDDVHNHVARADPGSPWIHDVESRRTGTVDMHFINASMPAAESGVVVWSPPGAVRISEIRNLRNFDILRDWWPMATSPAAPHSLAGIAGFQFFTVIRYPENVYVTYLGFRRARDLEAYLVSDAHHRHDGPFTSASFRADLDIAIHTGQLLSWFQREAGSSRYT